MIVMMYTSYLQYLSCELYQPEQFSIQPQKKKLSLVKPKPNQLLATQSISKCSKTKTKAKKVIYCLMSFNSQLKTTLTHARPQLGQYCKQYSFLPHWLSSLYSDWYAKLTKSREGQGGLVSCCGANILFRGVEGNKLKIGLCSVMQP